MVCCWNKWLKFEDRLHCTLCFPHCAWSLSAEKWALCQVHHSGQKMCSSSDDHRRSPKKMHLWNRDYSPDLNPWVLEHKARAQQLHHGDLRVEKKTKLRAWINDQWKWKTMSWWKPYHGVKTIYSTQGEVSDFGYWSNSNLNTHPVIWYASWLIYHICHSLKDNWNELWLVSSPIAI